MKIYIIAMALAISFVYGQSAFDSGQEPVFNTEVEISASNTNEADSANAASTESVEQMPAVEQADQVSSEMPETVQEDPVIEKPAEDIKSKLPELMNNIFDGKNVNIDNIISGDDPEVKGFISNIQAAPFSDNILSFEIVEPNSQAVKLVLYNVESQFLMHISPIDDYERNIKNIPYPVKDQGVKWHPTENYLIFQSNGYMNRDQLFMVEILDKYFMEDESIKITRIDLKEPKGTIDHCLHPEFNSTGKDLYFSVRIEKEDKNQRYNRYNNIACIKDVFKYKDSDYSGITYQVLFNKNYDQKKPVCSPVDPDMFAFISYNKDFKDGFGYADYSLIVHNRRTNSVAIVGRMNGFRDYPYQWGPSGKKLYFTKAAPISETPRDFRDDRINKINLHVADINVKEAEIEVEHETNQNSDIILGDVATKDYGMAFIGDDLVLMAKYDPYEAIFMVDMEKWRTNDGFYIKQLPTQYENDYPVLTSENFYFLKYEYFPEGTVSTIASIPYEPKIDEEALRKKKERRAKKKAARKAAVQDGE